MVSCKPNAKESIISDFESDSDLDRLFWSCHTLYSLKESYVSHGSRALKVDLFPSSYPGVSLKVQETDWSNFSELRFDVINPQRKKLPLTIRIDDTKDYPLWGERYNHTLLLEEGTNRIIIQLNTLLKSGSNKQLNLSNIQKMLIFSPHPDEKIVLYFDYFRLVTQ
jgi:hypothetical protein